MSDARSTRARAEIVDEICTRIAAGESVAAVFRTPGEGFPASEPTFWRWLIDDLDARAAYERATVLRAEKYAEQIVEIADADPATVFDEQANVVRVDAAAVQHQKLRVDARKWVAARMQPKRWGDRTILAGDADNPVIVDDPKGALLRGIVPHVADAGTGEADR